MMISCNVETGARKDLRSVQNIVIISAKFLYFRYLNICHLELLEKNFCRSCLILDLINKVSGLPSHGCAKRVKSFRKLVSKSLVISFGKSEKVIVVCKILYY